MSEFVTTSSDFHPTSKLNSGGIEGKWTEQLHSVITPNLCVYYSIRLVRDLVSFVLLDSLNELTYMPSAKL